MVGRAPYSRVSQRKAVPVANAKVSRSNAAAKVAAARRVSKPSVAPAVQSSIESYSPAGIPAAKWQQVRPVVIEAVLRAEPPSLEFARKLLRPAALAAAWAVDQGIATDLDSIFTHAVIDEWTARLLANGVTDGTVATYRSRMRSILGARRPAVTVKRRRLAAPYSPDEDRALRRAVTGQRSTGYRSGACLLYGLSRGAGLSSSDLSGLRIGHITPHGDTFRIDVADRTLWILDTIADVVKVGMALTKRSGDDFAVGSASTAKREVSRAAHRLKLPGGVPALSVSRCRSTWIVDHLNAGTPIPVIAAALGVSSTRFIDDLLEFCQPPADIDRERLLRGIR